MTKFLQYASEKMDLTTNKQGNSTNRLKNINQLIEALNNKVTTALLEDAVRRREISSSLHIVNATFAKNSTECSNNKNVSYSPMVNLNYVSTSIS